MKERMVKGERVLVTGATGGTGRLVVRRLLENGYEVRALVRDRARSASAIAHGVEIVEGDVTHPESLASAMERVDHIVYTAGVTSRTAGESIVKATVHDGVLNAIEAARVAGVPGRFVLMGAMGTTRGSPISFGLNLVKGKTLKWRRRAEEALRLSGLDYTIVHAGILVDSASRSHGIVLGQPPRRMWPWTRIGRADAAEVLVQTLLHPGARNTTFDALWGGSSRSWHELFTGLRGDTEPGVGMQEPHRT
jgi:uncharacterized protein YbjT (DUF2867 family)